MASDLSLARIRGDEGVEVIVRREFLRGGLLSAAGSTSISRADLKAASDFHSLKITAVDVFPLKTGSIFVLVRTNEGITGLGECSPMNARVIVSMLKDALVPIVLGKNPLDIDRLWDEMFHRTYKLGVMGAQPEAMSGIDIALWDILGKVTGLPLWQLFGGKRKDRIRMYSSIGGGAQATVAEQVRKAVGSVSQGFTALKMRMDGVRGRWMSIRPRIGRSSARYGKRSATRSISSTTPTMACRSAQPSD